MRSMTRKYLLRTESLGLVGGMATRLKLDYRNFTLPFMSREESPSDDGADVEENEDEDQDIEQFENKLPRDAAFLGQIDDEVLNFTSWKIEDHYYMVPWEGPEFDWAIFRISWDDNWGRYDWSGDVRIKGAPDRKEAAKLMLKGLFKRWGHDLRKSEYAPYRELVEGL